MKKILQTSVLVLYLILILAGCDGTTVNTGPYIEAGPVAVSVTINSDGSTVLSGSYSQRIVGIGPVGVGWTVGFDKVLSEETGLPADVRMEPVACKAKDAAQ